MNVLVAYASRHGATKGIAERIAQVLERSGLAVTLSPADQAGAVDGFDAFVIGSAAYNTHWLKEATQLVERHRSLLATRPLWLFSSGPVGTATADAKGRDVREVSRPHEFDAFLAALQPRDLQVFFGAYDPDAEPVGLAERIGARFTRMSVIRDALPAGDFRDWAAIEAWADGIARELKEAAVPPAAGAG
jgi:menaquinone-dependent protoporphyrinogen oxidase